MPSSCSGAGWGLVPSRLAKLCDRDAPPEALVELQTRLDAWLRPLNAPGLVLSLLPEAALGDAVAPVAANAPVHGDRYDYHVDADPALLPPGPFADYHSRYPNRAPGRPRFVSALCYLAPDWPPEFGAPTRFLDPPTGETLDVAPEPGRVVFLDQDISHTVVAPAAAARDRPRYSLVLKLVLHPGDAESTARFAPDPPTTIVGSARRA